MSSSTTPDVSNRIPSSPKKNAKQTPEEKIEEINKQLAEVRHKRAEMTSFANNTRVKTEKTEKKKQLHHPKLDFVLAEVVHSPYMTKPNEHYTADTFYAGTQLRELKKRASSFSQLPVGERPFDAKEIKSKFVKEISQFNATFINNVRVVIIDN